MIDNKRMKVDNVESISKKMNGVDWRMKWKEYLKESVLNDNKNCMLNLNVDWNEWNGLMWNGVFGDPNCRKNEMNVVAL